MPKGRSYSTESWKPFQKGTHTFIEDGFVHDKTLNFKAQFQEENQGVAINESIVEKADGLSGIGQAKFWFTTNAYKSLFISLGSANNFHVHYDNGVGCFKNTNFNIYGGAEFNRSFTEKIGKFGLEIFKNSWSYNTRFVYGFSPRTSSLDQKLIMKWKDFKLNAFLDFSIDQLTLSKLGFLFQWQQNAETTWYLRSYQNKVDKIGVKMLQGLTIGCNSNIKPNQTIGFETKISLYPWKGLQSLWLCSQWKFEETRVKAKVNKDLGSAVTITNKLRGFGQYSVGLQVSEVGTKNRFRFGTQIDLNL